MLSCGAAAFTCFLGCSLELQCLYKIRMSVLLKTLIYIRYLFVVIALCVLVFLAMLRLLSVQKNRERMSKQQCHKSQREMWTLTLFVH